MGRPSCHDQALRLLATRAHFAAELAKKLTRRGYEPEEIAETLERLRAAGYLDDAAAARSFVEGRQERQGLGRTRLRAELQRRGVGAEVVQEALAGTSDEDELARARQAAERWRRTSRATGPAGRASLARHLDRRGFSRRVVFGVVAEMGEDAQEGHGAEDGSDGDGELAD
jgi:regulatory protein